MEHKSEYQAWRAMKARCHNTRHAAFADYGGRGIAVCERWRVSFENFFADMGPKPTLHHSLDRHPNNDGSYEPGDCRWATKREQRTNQRRRRTHGWLDVTFTGLPYLLDSEAMAHLSGLSIEVVGKWNRIGRLPWSFSPSRSPR
jgi:hypothetical protein